MKTKIVIAVFILTMVTAACASPSASAPSQANTPTAQATATEAVPANPPTMEQQTTVAATPTAAPTIAQETPTRAPTAASDTPTTEAATPKPTPSPITQAEKTAAAIPDWFNLELNNVNTGKTFRIADFQGKVVLVETMAIWCPTCLRQQKEVLALHKVIGQRDDFVSLTLDIDPNESTNALKDYAAKNGFGWFYAVPPAAVSRGIGQLLGDLYLNPPSAPMFIIDRQGQIHPLPFGVKSAQKLQEALLPFLDEKA